MFNKMFTSRGDKITGTITFDQLAFEDSPGSIVWRRIKQTAATLFLVALVLVLIWAAVGVPYLRWDEPLADGKDGATLSAGDLAFTRYIGFGDSRRVHAGEYGEGLPWLIFIPAGDASVIDQLPTENAHHDRSSSEASTADGNFE